MNHQEGMNSNDGPGATIITNQGVFEAMGIKGIYNVTCDTVVPERLDEYVDLHRQIMDAEHAGLLAYADYLRERQRVLPTFRAWEDEIHNTVVTVGKNLTLDTLLAGSTYTVTGPFLGLISLASYSAIAAADTMASHAGWLEAGTTNAPQWTTPASGARASCNGSFSAASAGSKALSAAKAFSISTTGTVKGAFMVLGTGAVATNLDTNGTLLSAGLFSGGDKAVGNGDTLNVSWSLGL
jgi:hypothetical protein